MFLVVARTIVCMAIYIAPYENSHETLAVVSSIVGRGGALVEAMTFNLRVVGSTTALAVT